MNDKISIYVDGSFDPNCNIYGSSFVAVIPDGNIEVYRKAGDNPDTAKLRNVSGEMIAAMSAVSYAIDRGYSEVEILYDYLGIESWVSGAWKAKKELPSQYARFMKNKKKEIGISFQKVSAHKNIKYNEIADALAKQAIRDFYMCN